MYLHALILGNRVNWYMGYQSAITNSTLISQYTHACISKVVQYTFAEARLGRTPNPDIMCNSRVKFGTFFEHVGRHFRRVATGHYAQVKAVNSDVDLYSCEGLVDVQLVRSPDEVKDQTYVY